MVNYLCSIYSAIAPDTVTYNGEERVVVTPSNNNQLTRYQVIWVGSCRYDKQYTIVSSVVKLSDTLVHEYTFLLF